MKTLRYLIYRIKWKLADYITWRRPLNLDIELTNHCNLACVMCRHGFDPDFEKGMMPFEVAQEAVDQAAAWGIPSIKFQFRGESALYKRLEELVKYAKDKGIVEVQLNTNLVAFTKPRLKKLVDAGIDRLIVSIDGATKQTYERIRVGSSWEKLIDNLRYLKRLRAKVRIQMVHQKENEHEVEAFKEAFKRYGELKVKPATVRGGDGSYVSGSRRTIGRKKCAQPSQRLVIGWNGTVFGCCSSWYDEFPVGRFPQNTLKELWKGEMMKLLRTLAQDPTRGYPCEGCAVATSYKWEDI